MHNGFTPTHTETTHLGEASRVLNCSQTLLRLSLSLSLSYIYVYISAVKNNALTQLIQLQV